MEVSKTLKILIIIQKREIDMKKNLINKIIKATHCNIIINFDLYLHDFMKSTSEEAINA